MFSVSLTFGAMLYTLAAAGLVFGLWWHYDARDRRLYDLERRKTMYHCIKCDQLYAAASGGETSPCPRCGFRNQPLRF